MFVLTDGKYYVMENPMKIGDYIKTTSPVQAKQFTYKQARNLVQKSRKKYSWIKKFQLVDVDSGEKSSKSLNYKGNADVYVDENIKFDDSILDKIIKESNSIIGLAGWNLQQLNTYENLLNTQLSVCDSAESDIKHALEKYKEDNNGKKPQAHKAAKIGYLLDDVRDRHKRIKHCIRCVKVMQDAVAYQYSISKIKFELSKVSNGEYKGRTEYWKMALEILED